jgi:iron complex transport system ATP-binding protein
MMALLQAKQLTCAYGETVVIKDLNLSIPEGQISVLIGSNGCGKSTLLRTLARLLKPEQGAVVLDGKNISSLPTKEVARKMAILPQSPVAPEGLTVLQLVKQGRYPYQSWLKQWSKEDEEAVIRALEATGLIDLAEREVDALSGGQRQRAWLAMALAQDTDLLLLDEPTTYLDLAHQIELLDLLYDLNRNEGRTIVMVLHDLNLAARYADHMIAVYNQGIYAQGSPEELMTPALVEKVFGLSCQVMADPVHGTPMCVPCSKKQIVKRKGEELAVHA